ncbi:MAG: homoserine O-acetyltransferase [Caulobacterales bacterium]
MSELKQDPSRVDLTAFSEVVHFGPETPLLLDCGKTLENWSAAYAAYGSLNADRSNVVLIGHALTGDQFVAGPNPTTGRPAWWPRVVGPGKAIDTDKLYVICVNVLGGCMGSTGPASDGPGDTPWALQFPTITIGDMVRAQSILLKHLGIDSLFLAIGGSMGGMQSLQWAAAYPDRTFACAVIAAAARHSAQNIALYEVGRQAIMADPDWRNGDYALSSERPAKGLAVARMAAHITYLSEAALQRKFGRELQAKEGAQLKFDADFQVESYLRHQGQTFVDRFDANSYIYITRAMDYFDLAADYNGVLANAFKDTQTRFCVFAFSSDWHYPPEESRAIVRALNAAGANASYVEIETDKGHDAFLLDEPEFEATLRGFVKAAATARGLKGA